MIELKKKKSTNTLKAFFRKLFYENFYKSKKKTNNILIFFLIKGILKLKNKLLTMVLTWAYERRPG